MPGFLPLWIAAVTNAQGVPSSITNLSWRSYGSITTRSLSIAHTKPEMARPAPFGCTGSVIFHGCPLESRIWFTQSARRVEVTSSVSLHAGLVYLKDILPPPPGRTIRRGETVSLPSCIDFQLPMQMYVFISFSVPSMVHLNVLQTHDMQMGSVRCIIFIEI